MSATAQTGTVYIQGKPVGATDNFHHIPAGYDAFTAAHIERKSTAPKQQKTPRPLRTKAEWAAIGLESDEQRKERQAMEKAHRTAQIIKRAPYSDAGRNFPSQADVTNRITGRRLDARHQ